jgi:hypothetical protein
MTDPGQSVGSSFPFRTKAVIELRQVLESEMMDIQGRERMIWSAVKAVTGLRGDPEDHVADALRNV